MFDTALDILFPKRCGGCSAPIGSGQGVLCWSCRAALRPIGEPCCSLCGNPLEGRADHTFKCYHCIQLKPAFDVARSAVRFEAVAAKIIYRFKYRNGIWLRHELVNWLENCVRVWYPDFAPDMICPVPLYPARARQRGYNQASLLAAELARRLRRPFMTDALIRTRPTETQTHLTAMQRLSNVSQAFEAASARRLKDRAVLLVDDVMTTGATVSSCARALKAAGCRSVHVATLARGQ